MSETNNLFSVDREDFNSFTEDLTRMLDGVKGVGTVLETINPAQLFGDSRKLVNDEMLIEGLASVLAACVCEMQHAISHLEREEAHTNTTVQIRKANEEDEGSR
jgi:hypothetical protein